MTFSPTMTLCSVLLFLLLYYDMSLSTTSLPNMESREKADFFFLFSRCRCKQIDIMSYRYSYWSKTLACFPMIIDICFKNIYASHLSKCLSFIFEIIIFQSRVFLSLYCASIAYFKLSHHDYK